MKLHTLVLAGWLAALATPTFVAAAEDQPFIAKASEGTLMQIALADLAAQRAIDDGVDAFARKWLDDSKSLRDGLDTSAKAAGAELVNSLSPSRRHTLDEIAALDGAEFDLRFAQIAASEIDQLLLIFRKASESGEDARVKSLAEQSLHVLEQNLAAANTLQARLSPPGG